MSSIIDRMFLNVIGLPSIGALFRREGHTQLVIAGVVKLMVDTRIYRQAIVQMALKVRS